MKTFSEQDLERVKSVASCTGLKKLTINFSDPEKEIVLVLDHNHFHFGGVENDRQAQGLINEAILGFDFESIHLSSFDNSEDFDLNQNVINALYSKVIDDEDF